MHLYSSFTPQKVPVKKVALTVFPNDVNKPSTV